MPHTATANPLVLGRRQLDKLERLREQAAREPLDVLAVREEIKTPDGMRRHARRMTELTIDLPVAYLVTFSIETGHPVGVCRHLSMSSDRKDKVPTPEAVWMVAEQLGFVGGLRQCSTYAEDLPRGTEMAKAINLIQPIAIAAVAGAA